MSISLKKTDNNKFIINCVKERNTDSATVKHMSCFWSLSSKRPQFHDTLIVWLKCTNPINSSLWKINANVTISIISQDGTKHSQSENVVFHSRNTTTEDIKFLWNEVLNLSNMDNITIECSVEIKSTTGIHYKMHDFDKMDENINNTALIVEEKKLYVSKQILAMTSPVFHAMFYSDFKESEAEEIPIEDAKYDDFEMFLQLIYDTTTDITEKYDNVKNILKLADRFNVESVMKKCEDFLVTAKVHVVDRLSLCCLYGLTEAQVAIVASLTDNHIKECQKYNNEIDESTLRLLCQKLAK